LTAGLLCQFSLQLLAGLCASDSRLPLGLRPFCFCRFCLPSFVFKPLLPVAFITLG
jgi:hypothetical protein